MKKVLIGHGFGQKGMNKDLKCALVFVKVQICISHEIYI